ncbi:hypothetical protein DZD52_11660 [Xanthomonas nasturtii]|uniref:Uncharacterized protein n=1 Tax=Xanthomonas nasturtii TaxID=1843581 RepID=A0A3E1KJ19_9XANT|nr:hypothetical protein DZD52_11660 [Xanthomonas nasturtii]
MRLGERLLSGIAYRCTITVVLRRALRSGIAGIELRAGRSLSRWHGVQLACCCVGARRDGEKIVVGF